MPVRIVVGVTGHRTLPPDPAIARALDSVLDEIELRATGEARSPVGLTALSPLAEGADRLAAERILARPGGELEAVLPMPESEYKADFRGRHAREEFEGLMARSRSIRRLPPSSSRAEAYTRAGRYVVDHCDVLVSLWDGKPEEGPGGTAEIVRYARQKGRTLFWIDPEEPARFRTEEGRQPRRAGELRRTIRVFVSSTFRDMHLEREQLAKFVFPRLRKMCDQRRVVWGEVDLRWGITDEQKAENRVLPICLAEIDRCRPYFIGILGERYGWVPDDLPGALLQEESWLSGLRGRSVTELEILHGVLNDPAMAGQAFFYFRDPAYVESLPADDRAHFLEGPTPDEIQDLGEAESRRSAEDRARKLDGLKDRIRESSFPVRENYRNPKDFGELVFQDLALVIDRLFPMDDVPDPLEREAAEHEAFADSRRLYVGGDAYFERLDAHAMGDGPPIVVLGEPGSGKSALLANWARHFRDLHPDEAVILHFVGASAQSADWGGMTGRIIAEINRLIGRAEPVPYDPDELRREFVRVLQIAAGRGRLILVIDGLDQLEDRDRAPDLVWLPVQIPPAIRLILSTWQGRTLDEVTARSWPTLTVEPLSPSERETLLVDYLAQFRKTLSPALAGRIVAAPQASNPLYLRSLAEELRLFGHHEQLDRVLETYLEAGMGVELFGKILERCERDYEEEHPGLVGHALRHMWASRRGLSEAELLDLLGSPGRPLPMAAWAPLSLALENHLINRSGLLAFSHEYIRQAVFIRYLRSNEDRRKAHAALADYFEISVEEPRGRDEFPWQLDRAAAWDRLYALLADLSFFKAAFKNNPYEAWEYWADVEKNSSLKAIDAYGSVLSSPGEHRDHVWTVSSLLLMRGEAEQASRLFEYLAGNLVQDEDIHGGLELGRALHNWSMALYRAGKLDPALATSLQAESILRECSDGETVGKVLICQGNIHKALRQPEKALRLFAEAERFSELADSRADLANSWASQGLALVLLERYDEAAPLLEKAKGAMRQLGMEDEARIVLSSQAVVATKRGDLELALSLYREEERTSRKYGEKKQLALCLELQAFICVDRNDHSSAVGHYREAFELFTETGDTEQATSCWRLWVDALTQLGGGSGTLVACEAGDKLLAGSLQDSIRAIVLDLQAWLLNRLGRTGEALAKYRQAEEILIQAGDGDQLARNLYSQGILHLNARRHPEALAAFRAAAKRSRPTAGNTLFADSLDQQAYILRRAGRLRPALALSLKAERLFRRLEAPDGLSRCLNEQAIILKELGRYADSLERLVEQEGYFHAAGDWRSLVDCLAKKASLLSTYLARPGEALGLAEEALGLGREIGCVEMEGFLEEIIAEAKKAISTRPEPG